VIACRRTELVGKNVGTDDGDGRATANRRPWCVPRVADERDPAAGPVIHPDLADRIEVEVIGRVELPQEVRHLPTDAREQFVNKSLLAGNVVWIDVEGWVSEQHDGASQAVRADRVQRYEAIRRVERKGPTGQSAMVRHAEDGEIATKIVAVALLRPEGEPPDSRMEAVRADHEVEAAPNATAEGDVDAFAVVFDGGRVLTEEIVDSLPGRLVQDPREVTANDLDVAVIGDSRGQHGGIDFDRSMTRPLEDDAIVARTGPFDRLTQPHAVDHLHGGAEEINSVSTGRVTGGGRPLHDRGREAVLSQPEREHCAGDSAAGDEDRLRFHVPVPSCPMVE
jgi:hypothetical protein